MINTLVILVTVVKQNDFKEMSRRALKTRTYYASKSRENLQ